ncbi:MAG: glycosyltransferase family 4 protein [Oligoflexus sp.]|nr:glycosyltransferase family 4 protein [Pseudopedobacter sp.]
MNIIITAPDLDSDKNVSGISSVVNFIIDKNPQHHYIHFEIGKKDDEKRGVKWFLKIVKNYFKWFYLMATVRDKLVHFNLPLDKRAVIRDCPLLILTKLFGTKLVLHIHGGSYLENDEIPSWAKILIDYTFKGKTPKIVLGVSEKEFLEDNFKCKNVFVLPNSLPLEDAKKFNREKPEKHHIKILYLGRIRTDKGLAFTLSAFQTLKEVHNLDFTFFMAGKGRDEKLYTNKFKELLGDNFIFKGVVFGEKKVELLRECNTYILASFFEGLPMALLESMSFGLVPITTGVGSIKYVVKNKVNGLIVNKKSPKDIVDAILTLNNDAELMNTLSKNARNTIFTDFTPEKFIKDLNLIYNYE